MSTRTKIETNSLLACLTFVERNDHGTVYLKEMGHDNVYHLFFILKDDFEFICWILVIEDVKNGEVEEEASHWV